MFNFKNLDIECNTDDIYNSFVGIRRSSATNRMTFFLPKGFDSFKMEYDNVKNLFFAMYKTFKRFEADNLSRFNSMLDEIGRDRDNTYSRASKGYSFTGDEENEVLLYSKIDIIDNFFKVYKELDIDSIVEKMGITEKVDYTNIDRLLAEGIFLKNNAIFIDDNIGGRYIIESGISELVELYCYIYRELIIELDGEPNSMIWEAADNFSYKYLTRLQSLFDKDSYESTILILKDCLDHIDKSTPYKDYLYYDIYDVVEHFLYGQLSTDDSQGEFWGINNFSYIWEDMCNNFILSDSSRETLYCDMLIRPNDLLTHQPEMIKKVYGGHAIYQKKDFDNNFYIEMDNHKRWLRPDIVFTSKFNNYVDSSVSNKNIFFETETIKKDPLALFGNKVNLSFKLKSNNFSNNEDLKKANLVFSYLKNEFSNIKSKNHPLYEKSKGHTYKLISDSFIQLNNITEEVYNLLYERAKEKYKDDNVYIIDWKYVPVNFFKNSSEKLKVDITKQLIYEFCLLKSKNKIEKIVSQFCIPKYSDTKDIVLGNDKEILSTHGIEIIFMNFNIVQNYYVNGPINIIKDN